MRYEKLLHKSEKRDSDRRHSHHSDTRETTSPQRGEKRDRSQSDRHETRERDKSRSGRSASGESYERDRDRPDSKKKTYR